MDCASRAHLAFVFVDGAFKYSNQRAGLKLIRNRGDVLQALRLAEGADEAAALASRPADHAPLGKNYCPREHAEGNKNEQNGFGDRTSLKDEINDFAAGKKKEDGRTMHVFRGTLLGIID